MSGWKAAAQKHSGKLNLLRERSHAFSKERDEVLAEAKRKAEESVRAKEMLLHQLAYELVAMGVSKPKVAEAAGISRPTLYRWLADAEESGLVTEMDASDEATSQWKITREGVQFLGYAASDGNRELEFEVDAYKHKVLDPKIDRYIPIPEGTEWIFEKWIEDHPEEAEMNGITK